MGYANEVRRWLLPLVTIWPLVYRTFFAVQWFRAFATSDDTLFSPWIIAIHVLAFCTNVGLIIVYELHLFRRNDRVDDAWRAIWAVLLGVLVNPAMLVYWWRYIRVA